MIIFIAKIIIIVPLPKTLQSNDNFVATQKMRGSFEGVAEVQIEAATICNHLMWLGLCCSLHSNPTISNPESLSSFSCSNTNFWVVLHNLLRENDGERNNCLLIWIWRDGRLSTILEQSSGHLGPSWQTKTGWVDLQPSSSLKCCCAVG